MKAPPLILASGSPRRAKMMKEMGLKFRILPSDAPEADSEQLTGRELAELNAYRKARAVAKDHRQAVVFGCDTVVYLGTKPFGKPRNLKDAPKMLRDLSGRTHQVISGCCLMHMGAHRCEIYSVATDVRFRRLTNDQIFRYLKNIDPLDKAGGYAIQEHGEMIVESIHGSFTNVVGLPVEELSEHLKAFGIG